MLLCLGMPEFPVDVNVGRICSRLGWIPLDAEQALEVSVRVVSCMCADKKDKRSLHMCVRPCVCVRVDSFGC